MSDGRRPGPLESSTLHWPTGAAPGSAFAWPPPLLAPDPSARIHGEGDFDPRLSPLDTLGSSRPIPLPVPRQQPSAVVGSAGGFLGPVGRGADLIVEYYSKCGLETVGPGQVTVSGLSRFTTLEGLIDSLQASPQQQSVVVNHGNENDGLLVPVCRETGFNKTGTVISLFSGLADMAEQGPIDPKRPTTKVLLDGAVQDIGIKPEVVLRIVDKLVSLRRRRPVLHFRACNLNDSVMLGAYKSAFGAQMITFHGCRLLFVPFVLDQMKPGKRVADFSSDNNNGRARLRTFDDPLGLLSPMMLAINDIDGHTRVEQVSFIEQRSPEQVHGWAEFLLRQWQDTAPAHFVVPIMWENRELTFHCPLEIGWRQKLKFV